MCGIFGVHGHSDAVHVTQMGLYSLQHRGQESVGVAAFGGDGSANAVRSMGTLSTDMASRLDALKGKIAIGHTRYSTAGSSTIEIPKLWYWVWLVAGSVLAALAAATVAARHLIVAAGGADIVQRR